MKAVYNTISTLLLLASIVRLGACQTEGTLEILFQVQQNSTKGLSGYMFNMSVGTPPQIIEVGFHSDTSEVMIGEMVFGWNGTSGSLANKMVDGYDARYSKSAKPDDIVVTLERPANWNNESWPDSFNDNINTTYTYSSDNCTIGSVALPTPLTFVSGMAWATWEPYGEITITDGHPYWNTLGLGLSSASVLNYQALQNDSNAVMRGGVLDDLYSAGRIKSRSYSHWLDSPEKKTGHLLLGGVDEKAFIPPLQVLNTTVRQSPGLFRESDVLTVKAEMTGGQGSGSFNLAIGDTMLSNRYGSTLPPSMIIQLWEYLGVDYKSLKGNNYWYNDDLRPAKLADITPLVPCSYRSNQSTIDLSFSGSNISVALSMAELTWGNVEEYTGYSYGNSTADAPCVFSISAGLLNEPAVLGIPFTKTLYQVHDNDNKVISLAYTNMNATEKNVTIIPQLGGVAASNLTTVTTNTTKKNHAVGRHGSVSSSVFYSIALLAAAAFAV